MRQVDIIASGYEWMCPDCETFNRENYLPETVKCGAVNAEFKTSPAEHAYGG